MCVCYVCVCVCVCVCYVCVVCVCACVCVCVCVIRVSCVYIAASVHNAKLIHYISQEIKTSKWLLTTFIFCFSSPPPLSSLPPLSSPLSSLPSLSFTVTELLFSNPRSALFCDGVCQRWRAVLPLVSRACILRGTHQVLWRRNHTCHPVPSQDGNRVQGP